MIYEIKHWNGRVLVTQEADSLKSAIELLVRGDANLHCANLRGADLSDANLRCANLSGADLSGADLSGADLSGADLSGANLIGANLRCANLHCADLRDANLRDANLSGMEFLAVPELHQKILAAVENGGTLEMDAWHTCETTHCRAGWAVVLAGNVGRLLEAQMGSAAAGALITQASCPWLEKVPNFYATNDEALADIKACAEREKQEATNSDDRQERAPDLMNI